MECFGEWQTDFIQLNVADRFDMEAFAEEVFTMYTMTNGEDDSQARVLSNLFPVTCAMRDSVVIDAVKEYSRRVFKYEMEKYYVETNGKWIPEGEGLYPHLHPGSVISAICYPSDSNDGITFFDPRGNAARGYPKGMRHNYFKNLIISPKAGDILIFPSFVNHCVSHVKEETRLSLLHEFYVTENL